MTRKLPCLAALLAATCALLAPSAQAAGPPLIAATWVTQVTTSSANLRAEINPQELPTTYHFEYATEAAFLADGFTGATKVPAGSEASAGSTGAFVSVVQHPGALEIGSSFRFRVLATSTGGTTVGPTRSFSTREPTSVFSLPDGRGWEMVSPIEKNGGEIQGFGGNLGGGVLQAAAHGADVTYTSDSSFADAQGSPGVNQYLSSRSDSGWTTGNITPPMISGSYLESPTSGVPYQLFSGDLGTSLLSNGRRCRTFDTKQCPVENPPFAGSGAPAGYRNYYLRSSGGSFQATLTSTDIASLTLGPEDFELAFAGATPDLTTIVLSTCAALTPGASEVAGVEGECDPAKQNLYEKSGSTLKLINTAPGAALAAQSRAISADGSRVYWTDGANLYLRDGAAVKQVDLAQGGGGTFQTAATDGSVGLFTKGAHLYRYLAADGSTTDLTPGGGVTGVLGASDDATYVYYLSADGLFLWHSGTTTPVASSADASSYPPTTGTARVSADGLHLAFVSSAADVADYDNRNIKTVTPETEVYLFTAPGTDGEGILCASCNPYGERPVGPATLPGASSNGSGVDATHAYKPRALSADSNRLYFESFDELSTQDSNNDRDVYQWEAFGAGSCVKPAGCVNLISSGRAEGGAAFLDASADGSDVYFLTDGSLVPTDPGVFDVYDARVGGGFPLPELPVPCFGDNCQPLPPEPEDPTPGTLRAKTSGNLPPPVPKKPLHCKKSQIKKFGKCVKKRHHKKHGSHR